MWFKEGAEVPEEEGEEAPLIEDDFVLERTTDTETTPAGLQEKHAPQELDKVIRDKFTLNKDLRGRPGTQMPLGAPPPCVVLAVPRPG
jgi:hypothetical protein